jgi:cysteine desulfurase
MRAAIGFYANPSSQHHAGSAARAALEEERRRLAASLGSAKGLIAFTGSGSEADSIPLVALLRQVSKRGRIGALSAGEPLHILTTAIEHAAIHAQVAVLESLGFSVTCLKPESDGRVTPEAVAEALVPETALVSVMAVNNETGAVQPLAKIVSAVRMAARKAGKRMPLIHSDAVQAFGKIEFNPESIGLDCASISAHKIRGPRGVGALWHSKLFDAFVVGGGQEGGMRPGTENLQGIVAFACAAGKSVSGLQDARAHAFTLESRLLEGLAAIRGATVLPFGREPGDPHFSPFIVSLAFPGLSGEVMQRTLSDRGIAVSTGSACASRARTKTRRVLDAMGISRDLAMSAIRVSTGILTRDSDIDYFLDISEKLYKTLRTQAAAH